MLVSVGLVACLLGLAAPDDVVPAAIEAVLSTPDEPELGGLPELQSAVQICRASLSGTGRCVLDVGDVNGDGLADLALGLGPGAVGPTLAVVDGGTAQPIWTARPGGGSFRSLRALALDGEALALGTSSLRGRVELRARIDGALLWGRNLAGGSASQPATVSAVCFGDDLDGDGSADLLVAGGGRLLSVWALSGSTGATLWRHELGQVVADVLSADDVDGDGLHDVLAVGGEALPIARLLSGADGHPIWEQPLDGPGAVGLLLDDIDGDGCGDFVVGQFAEPAPCLLGLSGATGERLWASFDMRRNVTALALADDTVGTGLHDLVVGSFDNAVSGVLALNGLVNWRREVSLINGGSTLSVAVTSDLEGNGSPDVVASSLDHRMYLHGGHIGQFMANFNCRAKASAVATLADRTGDGRPETLITGNGFVAVLDGDAGTAHGPTVAIGATVAVGAPVSIFIWSYPTTQITLWGSLGTGFFQPSGVQGVFGLDFDSLVNIFSGPVPGVGGVGLSLSPLARSALGLEISVQALAVYDSGLAILSEVAQFQVVP